MRVAFANDLWARGQQTGHLDGIGVYTRELYACIQQYQDLEIIPFQFGKKYDSPVDATVQRSTFSHPITAAASLAFNQSPLMNIEQKIDLFHATDHHIPVLKSIPVISTVMDMIPFTHQQPGLVAHFKRIAFKHAIQNSHSLITISNYSADQIKVIFNPAKHNIHVIPLGVNPIFSISHNSSEQQLLLQKYKIPAQSFLFIGTLQTRKNIERILAAFAKLPLTIQRKHPLVIIGKARSDMPHVKAAVLKAAAHMPIYWLQNVPTKDLPPLMNSALAMIFPSLLEGFGLPVIESFAAGLPVITSNTTSLPEIAGQAAMLVDPESVDQIHQAMKNVADSDSLRTELIALGKERAKQYSWQITAKLTHELYRSILR